MTRWLSVRAAARYVGRHHRSVEQRLLRKNPMPHDYARDPDGRILEPRMLLISTDVLDKEYSQNTT